MRIQHNISALNSWGKLGINQNNASKNLEKLSSGYRINRAGDDAAGLAISEKMRGQIRGLDMASKNAQDGISLIQTAEGALDETHSILQRMRELAVQSANGTYQDEDRKNTDLEVQALKEELNRIASSTHFNKIQLLDGSLAGDSVKGSGGKAAAKVTVSDAAIGGKTVNKAEKGVYEINAYGDDPMGAIQPEATNDYTFTYKDNDGKTKTETVIMRFDSVNHKIVDANGNKLGDTSSSTATIKETMDALKTAVEKSSLGDKFKVELSTGDKGLKFTAKEAGTGAAAIDSVRLRTDGATSQILGQGTAGGKTVTLDLSNVDISKINNNDTLSIGGQTVTFVVNTAATQTYDATNHKVNINLVKTTESLTEAIVEAIKASATAMDFGSLSATGSTGAVAKGATFTAGTGDDKSKIILTLDTELGATQDPKRDDVQAIMGKIAYGSAGKTLTGGYIGLGSDSVTYGADATTKATDRYESYDMAQVKAWNPGNDTDDIADHVFEVNGEKFIFVKQDAEDKSITDDVISKATAIYGNELNVVTINSGDTDPKEADVPVTNEDVLHMAERIKEKTGVDVRVNGTKLEFHPASAGIGSNASDGKLVFQIGANGSADQRVSMSIDDMSSKGIGVDKVDITTADNANKAIDVIDEAINTVSGTRANLGAMQNRLEHTINSLNTSSENLTAAESRIRDVDMAKEMMEFTKNNILTQAAQAMLAQANQQPQGVLQLLQ